MKHKSGCKIEPTKNGGFELTYFGVFSTSEQSQSMVVRNLTDLKDIYKHIGEVIRSEAEETAGQDTDG